MPNVIATFGSNRTFMELKLTQSTTVRLSSARSNRTFMELKLLNKRRMEEEKRF